MSHTVAANVHAVAGKHEYALKFNVIQLSGGVTLSAWGATLDSTGDISWIKPSGSITTMPQAESSWINELGIYEMHSDCWANIKELKFLTNTNSGSSYDNLQINLADWDFNYLAELERLTIKSGQSYGEASLINISNAKKLKYLTLSYLPLTGDFSELNLEAIPLLEELYLNYTASYKTYAMTLSLANMDLSAWPNLTKFSITNIDATGDAAELTIGNSPNLREFELSNGSITGNIADIDFTQAPSLEYVISQHQGITSLDGLDFSANTNFNKLLLNNNASMGGDLTQIILPPSTQRIYASNNVCTGNIGNLNLLGMPNLAYLSMENTSVSGNIHDVDFTNSSNLQLLDLTGNSNIVGNLNQINFTGASALRNLYLSRTGVTGPVVGTDLSPLVSLTYFFLEATPITGNIDDFDFTSNTSLYEIVLKYIPNLAGNIHNLNIMNTKFLYIEKSPFIGGDVSLWDLSKHPALTYLSANGTSIGGDITGLAMAAGVVSIKLNSTQISGNVGSLNLGSYTSLTTFSIEYCNNLTGSFAGAILPPNLSHLSISSNNGSYLGDIGELDLPNKTGDLYSRESNISYPTTGKSLSNPWTRLTRITLTYATISQGDLDNLLADCVTSGSTGKYLNLGHASSAPSTAGQNSIATLQSRGWTIYI